MKPMKRLRSICLAGLILLVIQWLILPPSLQAAPVINLTSKMRPYSGIGLLLLAPLTEVQAELAEPSLLYEEPSLFRIGRLETSNVPAYEWIFGAADNSPRLIVTSRKGGWLRVVYDDAGREAWLKHPHKAKYLAWDSFLKGRSASLLAGLQKRYYQTSPQPGAAPSGMLAGRKPFKVIRVESDWALVMPDKESLTWLRWRDEDGRLLIAFERYSVSRL
jgi:hypothetical protein